MASPLGDPSHPISSMFLCTRDLLFLFSVFLLSLFILLKCKLHEDGGTLQFWMLLFI